MKTSEAERVGYRCPKCGGSLAKDRKSRGFVRHVERFQLPGVYKENGQPQKCRYGRKQKDKQ